MDKGELMNQNSILEGFKQDNLNVLKSRKWRQSVGRFHKQYEKFLTRLYDYDYVYPDDVIYGCGDMVIINSAKDFAE